MSHRFQENPSLENWDNEEAAKPLHLNILLSERTARLIRFVSAVTGLSPEQVATQTIDSEACATMNIRNMVNFIFRAISPQPTEQTVEMIRRNILAFLDAGQMGGFDEEALNKALGELNLIEDEETARLLKMAAIIMNHARSRRKKEPLAQLLSRSDLANRWGVTIETLRRREKAGKLPFLRMGRRVKYLPEDIERIERSSYGVKKRP
jgi:predicted HTH transcriptional regulator